jgi:hypothetical protein
MLEICLFIQQGIKSTNLYVFSTDFAGLDAIRLNAQGCTLKSKVQDFAVRNARVPVDAMPRRSVIELGRH